MPPPVSFSSKMSLVARLTRTQEGPSLRATTPSQRFAISVASVDTNGIQRNSYQGVYQRQTGAVRGVGPALVIVSDKMSPEMSRKAADPELFTIFGVRARRTKP